MRFLTRRNVLATVAAACAVTACAAADKGRADALLEDLEIVTTKGRTHRFKVEIADTDVERAKGLMYRESLPRDRGMLFQFDEMAERSFWMKNTYIPLDIIYIASDGKIVSIARNTTPFSESPIPSFGPANGVLEINGGQAAELGIEPGDTVRHPFFKNK